MPKPPSRAVGEPTHQWGCGGRRSVGRRKQNPHQSDYADARLLADLCCVGCVSPWLAPPAIRELRRLVRYAVALSRNHYDRLGHVAQGCAPAIVAREILLRTSPLRPGGWLFFLVTCVCVALSATYELLEWLVSVLTGTAADAFLGTQGDVWDTQQDLTFALGGALVSQLVLGGLHDRLIRRGAANA